MKFFIPAIDDISEAENFYQATIKRTMEQLKCEAKVHRIFSLDYRHDGKFCCAEVGQIHPRIGKTVCVIFETGSGIFVVCFQNCNLPSLNTPLLIGKNEVSRVVAFEH